MAAHAVHGSPRHSFGQENKKREWVAVSSNVNRGETSRTTKLLFNEAIPTCALNRATRVNLPAPIIIERLLPRSDEDVSAISSGSSFSYTALSEERLDAAVKLAQRDLRRRRLESLAFLKAKHLQETSLFETSDVELLRELGAVPNANFKVSSPKDKGSPSGVRESSMREDAASSPLLAGHSPPTRDPGPGRFQKGKHTPLSQEIYKLQHELQLYIEKVEELGHRGENFEELLEPEELARLEIRRQKHAARSSQVIYVLQQQVKEIEADIEKLRREKLWDTKKFVAINKLALAHRGALRTLQGIIHQLSDLSRSKMPSHCKEIGQLLRQLSLCSASVEEDQDSAVHGAALDILRQLQILDAALSRQERLERMRAQAALRKKPPPPSTSPYAAPTSPGIAAPGRLRKPANPRRGLGAGQRRPAIQKPKRHFYQPSDRMEVLRSGLQLLAQQRELRELHGQTQGFTSKKLQQPEKRKFDAIKLNQNQEAGFHQPTVSSRLRLNPPPEKQPSLLWIPTSHHSPPRQRSPPRGKPEPRCLFSTLSPPKQQVGDRLQTQVTLGSAKSPKAQNKASRKARSDKASEERQRKWDQQCKEFIRQRERRSSEDVSEPRSAEEEHASKQNGSPSLTNRKAANSANQLREALLEDLLEDNVLSGHTAKTTKTDRRLEDMCQHALQVPNLEHMLLRVEEIQKDEEEVRRRFTSIAYSDPLNWNREGFRPPAPSSRPASPQPIRLTRPVLKPTSAVDIVLKKPLEVGHSFLIESEAKDENSTLEQTPTSSAAARRPPRVEPVLSVPSNMLRSIRRYQDDYDAHLDSAVHRPEGVIDPCSVADRLAEEFLSEVLTDVAAEFQDVVEDYAAAVFTSEFLQPTGSSPDASDVVGQ